MVERNWAGTIEYSAPTIARPTSVAELRDVVRRAQHCRVLGTRHSFNHIADSAELVSLEALPDDVVVDPIAQTVELNPAMTYGRLAPLLHEQGLALHDLASLPHISIGGAIATGTHGSGDALGHLATAVSALDIMRADGHMVRLVRGDLDFDGAVVALGGLGVTVRIRLDLEPEYHVGHPREVDGHGVTFELRAHPQRVGGDGADLAATHVTVTSSNWSSVSIRVGCSATTGWGRHALG